MHSPGSVLRRFAMTGLALVVVGSLASCAASSGDSAEFDRVIAAGENAPAPEASTPGAGGSAVSRGSARGNRGTAKGAADPAFVFPVRSAKARYVRAHHDYPATDIFAPCGAAVVAPVSGRVVEVSRRDRWSSAENDGATRGGLSVTIVAGDVRYYGSHLRRLTAAATVGGSVQAGEELGTVGSTGSARGTDCHLHFGLSPACGTGDWWVRRGVVNPYAYLRAWQQGTPKSPAREIAAWRTENTCPKTAPPS